MPDNTTTRLQDQFLPGSSLTRFNKELLAASGIVVLTSAQFSALGDKKTGVMYVVTDGSFNTPAGIYTVYPLSVSGVAPSATQGLPYSFTPTVTGGTGIRSFVLNGILPAGLSFNNINGSITGTPTVSGNVAPFSISVFDNNETVILDVILGAGVIGGSTAGAITVPMIQFSVSSILENTTVGTVIGNLTVVNSLDSWTFSKTIDPDNKFTVASNGNVTLSNSVDYETKTSHSVGFQATNGSTNLTLNSVVSITNVLEGTLTPSTANMIAYSGAGTVIATVTGLDVGANETIATITPNDGRFVIASGNRIVAGGTTTAVGVIPLTVTTSAGRTLSLTVYAAASASSIQTDTPTANMLAAMNATQADWNAISGLGLKQIGPSGMIIGRAMDPGRTDNGRGDDNYVSSVIMNRDYNAVVFENQQKPSYEIKQGELTTAGIVPGGPNSPWPYEPVEVSLSRVAPDMLLNKAFHLGAGWNSYLPTSSTWTTGATGGVSIIQKLTDDPAFMKTYLDNRVAQIAAYYNSRPGEAAKVHRVDIVNELSNQPANGVSAADDGWRIANNALRTASKTTAGLEAYGAGNTDSEKWIQRLFTQFRDIFPNADLCWCDFNTEQVQVADDLLSARYSYNPSGPTSLFAVASDNSGANNRFRLERVKGEVWRYKKLGIPVTGIAYQMHTSSFFPISEIDYRASLWDWNRWGVRPAATEINADMYAPGNLGSSPSNDTIYRWNAVHCARQLEIMLEETPCREAMLWTVRNAAGTADIQPTSHKEKDYPLRSAIALTLKRAKPVASRTLKRGSHLTFRTRLSQNVEATGTQSFSSNRVAQTAAGYVRRSWDWYNDTWMPMPIDPTNMILRAQFVVNSNSFSTAGSTILGEFSTDGATGISLVGKSNNLFVRQRIGGTNTDIQVPGVTLSTSNTLKQAAYIAMSSDRTTVKVGYGTLSVTSDATTGAVTVTPTQNTEQTITLPAAQPVKSNGHIYIGSDAQGTTFHSSLQMQIAAVYHGPDYPTDVARQALAVPYRQEAWVPMVGGSIYAGD